MADIPAHLEMYVGPLHAFMPKLQPEQVHDRCGILEMRDRATAGLRRASDDAAGPLEIVISLACRYAFAPMSDSELATIWASCVSMMHTAEALRLGGPKGKK